MVNDGGAGWWIAGAALAVSAAALFIGVLRKPIFVPAATAQELRERIEDLERRIEDLERTNGVLEQQNVAIMREREWWREQYRLLKSEMDSKRFGDDG